MPNSSDWVSVLQGSAAEPGIRNSGASPAWMDALLGSGDFVEGLPIARHQPHNRIDPTRPANAQERPSSAQGAGGHPAAGGADLHADLGGDASVDSRADARADPVLEAFARGEEEGRRAAKAEYEAALESQRALRLTFRNFDSAAIDTMASELADTVIALCGQALEGFVPEPGDLQSRCQAAAKRLGTAAQDCALHLNPQDIALLDPAMLDQWRVIGDDLIARGGLRFEGPNGSVSDGPNDWHRAIASAIRG